MRIAIFQPDINNYPSIDSRLLKIKSIIQSSESLDVPFLNQDFRRKQLPYFKDSIKFEA